MLRVGTSGWQYPSWRGRFYPRGVPAARWLEWYAQRFATVEVNNTFYRLPERATFAAWQQRVPSDFTFAIKASRYLTHYRRLRDPSGPVELLLARAEGLGARLGPVLLQLPPDLQAEPERLDETLRAFGPRTRVAVEFRHPSWYVNRVRSILEARGAALCWVDRDGRQVGERWPTAPWCYVRFHHGTASPGPCYGVRALARWVDRVHNAYGPGADGYVYFNNDGEGCAVRDARVFARLASKAGLEPTRAPAPAETPVGGAPVRTLRDVTAR
jgi:uncharacterized protein YecE (DUF72 family)